MSSKIRIIINQTRYLTLSFTCGILLSLSFPGFNLNFLSWVAFIPLFFILDQVSPKRAFLFSYIAGVTFFLISIFWLTNVTVIGWFVLCLYLGLYFAFFGLIANFFFRYQKPYKLLISLPCLWVSLEFIRSFLFSGFGWNSLGYCQFKNLSLIQAADFSGVYGISFLIIFANCIFWIMLKARNAKKEYSLMFFLCLVFVLSAVLAYGATRLNQDFTDSKKSLRVSVVQPNIPQNLKWDPAARRYILQTLTDLSLSAAKLKPDIIIWPESAVPDYLTDDPAGFMSVLVLARELKTNLLTGVIKYSQDKFYNSALLISSEGNIAREYDKLHLVPYGEFIPFRNLFPFMAAVVGIGDFTPGEDYTVFRLNSKVKGMPEINFAVLICFEDVFANLSREFIKNKAEILINITNDAWFGQSAQPEQHLSQSVFRAIENRTQVIRCANTGISGLVNAKGEILKFVTDSYGKQIFIPGSETFRVEAKFKRVSFYGLYGDWFAYICFGLCMLCIINLCVKREG